jgi:branched-chain amino acid transport system permease protein
MALDASGLAAKPGSFDRVVNWVRKDPIRLFLYGIGLALVSFLVYVAGYNILNPEESRFTLERLLQLSIFGLAQGSIYALIALGYTLVYGILFMINFAHGEVFMSGAYLGFFAINAMERNGLLYEQPLAALLITMLVGICASVTIAVLLERIAYRPLRGAPRLVPLITAIGASITLQQLFLRLFGSSTRTYPDLSLYVLPGIFREECSVINGETICRGLDIIRGRYDVEFQLLGQLIELRVRPLYFIVFFIALLLMAALWFFVRRTNTGKAMRAVAEDKNTAALMGINVNRIIVVTFILGAVLAGAAAVLFALYNRQVTPFMGFVPGIKAFTAAVLGGIGNIPGAMFGGLFLGMVESIAPPLLNIPSQLQDVISFGLLVLVLIFRPTGLLGEVLSEKKA